MFLLDVNVLIALVDPLHTHHKPAWNWFEKTGLPHGWATCPITEIGTIRILSARNYLHRVELQEAAKSLEAMKVIGGYKFLADDISPCNPKLFRHEFVSSKHSTDGYLLALASHHGAALATFDRSIPFASILAGRDTLHLIET